VGEEWRRNFFLGPHGGQVEVEGRGVVGGKLVVLGLDSDYTFTLGE
jgi:hypothetical protein